MRVKADVAFHDIIYKATDNKRLNQIINNVREQMYRYRVEYLKRQPSPGYSFQRTPGDL